MGSSNSTTNHNSSTTTTSPETSKIEATTQSTRRKGLIRLISHISSQNSIPKDEEFNESSIYDKKDNRRINKTADLGKRIKKHRNMKERIYCMLALLCILL